MEKLIVYLTIYDTILLPKYITDRRLFAFLSILSERKVDGDQLIEWVFWLSVTLNRQSVTLNRQSVTLNRRVVE